MVAVGGMGRPFGAILGVIIIQLIGYWTRGFGGEYTLLIVAALSLPIVLLTRGGVAGSVATLARRYLGRPAARWAD